MMVYANCLLERSLVLSSSTFAWTGSGRLPAMATAADVATSSLSSPSSYASKLLLTRVACTCLKTRRAFARFLCAADTASRCDLLMGTSLFHAGFPCRACMTLCLNSVSFHFSRSLLAMASRWLDDMGSPRFQAGYPLGRPGPADRHTSSSLLSESHTPMGFGGVVSVTRTVMRHLRLFPRPQCASHLLAVYLIAPRQSMQRHRTDESRTRNRPGMPLHSTGTLS
mmetsp:Transcript_11645/g.29415  ORF Transcript_11645/g.29415 Transcript_11645/m.29415 type:complete len:225 (-) Transcript_11645:619-1293(-)